MLHSLSLPAKETPSWIGYAHTLIARQNDILRQEAIIKAQRTPRVLESSSPPDRTELPNRSTCDDDTGIMSISVTHRPLSTAGLLVLLRLAQTYGSSAAFESRLTHHSVTLLRGFAIPDLPDVAKITGDLMVPKGWNCLFHANFDRYTPPALVVLRPDVHHDKIEATSITTYTERIVRVLETGLPLMLLLPDEVILPDELRTLLPEPIMLAPLSREILLAALDAWHPDAAVLADASMPEHLPDDAAIARLTPLALRLAFAAPDPEQAITRLAQSAPKAIATGPHLDQIADDNPALPAARRMVADLRDWQAGGIAWSDLTRSLLLYGPPGTGKTWLAQAMATSAGITHLGGSFAEWQAAGHLGHMLHAMRKTFAEAFAAAPAILTIDEIDAVGSRSDHDDQARNYRTQVINGFLEQMDMIGRKEGVIVVGTCNHPARIDPAILRAGRFDLRIEIGPPGPEALAQILRRKLGEGFDPAPIATLARAASGCTPAQIDAAVRMARSICRAERRSLQLDDIRKALALPQQQDALDWRIAVHEAGHAVVCTALGLGKITRITLTPRGGEIARRIHPHEMRLADFEQEIAYTLAGRAAEQLILGNVSAGAGGGEDSDLAIATRIAVTIETCYGLGIDGPLWTEGQSFNELGIEQKNIIHARLSSAEARAVGILREHHEHLLSLARMLQQQRHLCGNDLRQHLPGLHPGAP